MEIGFRRPRLVRAKLIDSYELERRPVAETNMRHSVRNFDEMSDLLEVCGLRLNDFWRLQALQQSTAFRMLPFAWQATVIDRLGKRALRKTSLLAEDGKRGKQARSESFVGFLGKQDTTTSSASILVSSIRTAPSSLRLVVYRRRTTPFSTISRQHGRGHGCRISGSSVRG
jgi:hypothetical protein